MAKHIIFVLNKVDKFDFIIALQIGYNIFVGQLLKYSIISSYKEACARKT